MTPQEQLQRILSPNKVMVLDHEEMKRNQIGFDTILALWDRGILLSEDIYKVRDKGEVMTELENVT